MKDQAMTDPIDHDEILEDFAPPAPIDEGKLPLSWWAVISCIAGLLSVGLSASFGGTVAIVAILIAVAAKHDINRGAKAGAGWASSGIWFGGLGLVLSILIHVLGS